MSDEMVEVAVRIATAGAKTWGVCPADAGREAPLVWLPKSQIDDERAAVGYTGPLLVPGWLAADRGLTGPSAATTTQERQTGSQRTLAAESTQQVADNRKAIAHLEELVGELQRQLGALQRQLGVEPPKVEEDVPF